MTLKKCQNPEGGWNQAGPKYYENKDGEFLKHQSNLSRRL